MLSSTGKSFCAGADLNWMKRAAGYSPEENLRDARNLATLLKPRSTNSRSRRSPASRGRPRRWRGWPGGRLRYRHRHLRGAVRADRGQTRHHPGGDQPYVIAAIGERYARRYMLTAERFSASEAYRIGLVHEIVPDETGLRRSRRRGGRTRS